MNYTFCTPINSLEYFALLIAQEVELPLTETAANIAQIEHPNLSLLQIANDMDQLVHKTYRKIPQKTSTLNKVRLLNELFYNELHFRSGNYRNHEDADLSCINFVLQSRRGTDLTLGIIYLELAQSLHLKARGILFPEQFLIKIRLTRSDGSPAEIIIAPSTGKSLNASDIQALASPHMIEHGLVDEYDAPIDLFLKSASSKDIIAHILYHLRTTYQSQYDWARLIQILDRLILLQPDQIDFYRDRGFALAKNGQLQLAIIDLEHYLQQARTQHVPDSDYVLQQLNTLKST